ncbi:hypothetical protein [Bacteriovorax sp. Seq25_V]|uniref:hypothetical protein n=1 Tax=Bacteriovorax sp. Seq25_V TaxID=1201288 RepID=UPI000389F02F|nr:hypothetical protein [Bacteriovorax sp. Seq25_V]EQC43393.1 hypothetical protein M900_2798 [Bacteriovorax sp. Seq25_V]
MKILVLLLTLNTFAAIPTMEGLFRNSINPDITDNLIVVNVKASVKPHEEEAVADTAFYKVLINNTSGERKEVIIAKYATAEMDNDHIIDVKFLSNEMDLLKEENRTMRNLNFATLSMFTTNSSVMISKIIKKFDSNYTLNSELVNLEKKELFAKYKKYLINKNEYDKKKKQMKKDGITVEEGAALVEPVSPLTSEDEEEKKRIEGMLTGSIYNQQTHIKLSKDGAEFFWNIETDRLTAKFKNETHQLKSLKLNMEIDEVAIIPNDYVTFKQYQLPKKYLFKNKQYENEIEIVNYYTFQSKNKSFSERVSEYKKIIENTKYTQPESSDNQPQILLKDTFF